MADAGFEDADAGALEALLELLLQLLGDLVQCRRAGSAPRRRRPQVVVRVAPGQVPHGRLALHDDVVLEVVDVEERLNGVWTCQTTTAAISIGLPRGR